jgi:hypothetical protein
LLREDRKNGHDALFKTYQAHFLFLLCHAPPEYDPFHDVFRPPAVLTLSKEYQTKIDRIQEQLTVGTDAVLLAIQELRQQNHPKNSQTHANLGVDVFSVIPDKRETDFQGHRFLFILRPWDHQLPTEARSRVFRSEHGLSDPTIQNPINDVLAEWAPMNFHLHILFSDVDQGYWPKDDLFFQSWYPILCDQGFTHALAFLCAQRNVPVLDFLHLAKSAWSKLL